MQSLRPLQRGIRQNRRGAVRTRAVPSNRLPPRHHAIGSDETIRRWYAAVNYAVDLDAGLQPPVVGVSSAPRPDLRALGNLATEVRDTLRNEVGGIDAWVQRLDTALRDLSVTRRKKIAIVGSSLASPRGLVDSLLQDPISDPLSARQALLDRHVDTNHESLEIAYSATSSRTPDHVSIPSTWLRNSGCDLLEIHSSSSVRQLDAALTADALVLVVDPFTLGSIDQLLELQSVLCSSRPAIVVVNGDLPESISEKNAVCTIQERFASMGHTLSDLRIYFTNSASALKAVEALHDGLRQSDASPSRRSKAFELFQHSYLKSRVAPLQSAISGLLDNDYQSQTALSTVVLATNAIATTLAQDREDLNDARRTVEKLKIEAVRVERHASNVSVITRTLDGGLVEGGVDDEVGRARQAIETLFRGRFAWTNLLVRLSVDDVGTELASYISRNFAAGLERQIIFETGQLAQLQTHTDGQADDAVRQMSTLATRGNLHPLASPILRNHLSTLSLAIPKFNSDTLLECLRRRRSQLEASAHRVQTEARKGIFSTAGLAITGLAASWWIYVPPVAALPAVTATGLGALGVVLAIYLGQRRWDRAQKTFWREWDRSTEMLRADLQHDLTNVIRTRVTAKTNASAEGLRRLIGKREARLSMMETKVSVLREKQRRLLTGVYE